MLQVESFLLAALFRTLNRTQVFRDDLENLEELASHKLDFIQVVFLIQIISVLLGIVLFLDKFVLFLDKLKPWTHVTELHEDIRVHLLILDTLAIRP